MINTTLIRIDHTSMVPKYKQLILGIHAALKNRKLRTGQKIPSINEVAKACQVSRDTVLKAYDELQSRGVIISMPGKGYYIRKTSFTQKRKIFLLFDKLTAYKEVLYDAFVSALPKRDEVDMFFHNFNVVWFESLIRENIGQYTDYVIMPIPSKSTAPVLDLIEKDKLYILDRGRRLFGKKYPSVCQHFKNDMVQALKSGIDLLSKYKNFYLLLPNHGHYPQTLVQGFKLFCRDNQIKHTVIRQLAGSLFIKGNAFLVLDDRNLVQIVKEAGAQNLQLGSDLGIISYNDSPLKSIVANGITTISTDFELMGKSMAEVILSKKKVHIDNPASLIRRNSL